MPVIRTTYYAKDRLPLITEPLRRAYEALRRDYPGAAIFLRSGWLRGSHLDLCVLPSAGGEVDCEPQAEQIRAWIAAHPSTAEVVPDEYVALSKKLGALEGIGGPFTPLRPDNTVELDEYSPPRLVDGHEALQAAYVHFFDGAAPVMFALAELKRQNATAASMVLIGMLAQAADQLKPEGISRGHISLQAHADMFFANFDRSGKAREQFERLETAWRSNIDDAVAGRGGLGVPDDARESARTILERWAGVLSAERENVTAIARRDKSWFSYNPSLFPTESTVENPEHAAAFAAAGMKKAPIERGHTLDVILQAKDADLEFFSSEPFQVFRILLNMYYSLLPTLSVSPAERFGMCYLVSNSYRRNKS